MVEHVSYKKFRELMCPVCFGRRIIPTPDKSEWQICPLCRGRGVIVKEVDLYK